MDIYRRGIISIMVTKMIVFVLIVVFVFDFTMFPVPTLARDLENGADIATVLGIRAVSAESKLPENEILEVKRTATFVLTAYNSEAAQCDSSPCITANGFDVCKHNTEDTLATNVLPFGTRVRIPDLFGERVFIVRDRMNARYSGKNRIDVWMKNKQNAQDFGVKTAKIEVLE